MKLSHRWRQRAGKVRGDVRTLSLALKDPRTPWYAKVCAAIVVGYALSPIDLIPDPIPVLGYLDDLILLPVGLAVTMKMIPQAVLAESRLKVHTTWQGAKRAKWIAAGVIIALWVLLIGLTARFLAHMANG